MPSNRGFVSCLSIFMMFFILITSGCKQHYSLKSTWLDKEVTIDGVDKEWNDTRRYYDEKSKTRIGIYNDNENLYIRLVVMDSGIQMSIQRRGLTMWLCKTGKSETVWGLRYPFGAQGLEEDAEFGGFNKPEGPREIRKNDSEQQNQQIHEAMKDRWEQGGPVESADAQGPPGIPPFGDFEHNDLDMPSHDVYLILDPEKEREETLLSDEIGDLGVFCKFTQKRGAGMVYEIKIPLVQSEKTPYAAQLSPKQIVSIGFITEKISGGGKHKKDGKVGGPGGGGPGGGGMGGGGRGGGGMGGRPGMGKGPMGGSRAEAIEFWANIELSSNPVLKK